jgi:hypothetical protein
MVRGYPDGANYVQHSLVTQRQSGALLMLKSQVRILLGERLGGIMGKRITGDDARKYLADIERRYDESKRIAEKEYAARRKAAWGASDEAFENGCRKPNEDARYCPVCSIQYHRDMHLYGDCDCEVSGMYY